MELTEKESLYEAAKEKIALLEVIYQPEDKGAACVEIAGMLKSLGDFQDAAELAEKYEAMSKEVVEKAMEASYSKGQKILDSAKNTLDYDRAIRMFDNIKGYKDAAQKKEECIQKKHKHIKNTNIRLLIELIVLVAALATIGITVNNYLNRRMQEAKASKSIIDTEIGKDVTFGNYQWTIIDKDDEKAILVAASDKADDLKLVSYHNTDEAVTWETSDVRAWLNGEFLENGFSDEERERILLTDVVNNDNETYGTDGGNDTQDYVYLLSVEEYNQYYEYTKSMPQNWYLRTPGHEADTAVFITSDHKVHDYGCVVNDQWVVRPVIQVQLEQE